MQDERPLELHPDLHRVLWHGTMLALVPRYAPLGPEYHMYLDELNRATRIMVDGSPRGTTC